MSKSLLVKEFREFQSEEKIPAKAQSMQTPEKLDDLQRSFYEFITERAPKACFFISSFLVPFIWVSHVNESFISEGGKARAHLILYLGVSKIFCCKCVTKELDTKSPVAELAFFVLPLQALLADFYGLGHWPSGYFLAVTVLSC